MKCFRFRFLDPISSICVIASLLLMIIPVFTVEEKSWKPGPAINSFWCITILICILDIFINFWFGSRLDWRLWTRGYRKIQRDYAAIRKQALVSKATKFSELPVMPASIPIPILRDANFPFGDNFPCVQLGKCRREEQIRSLTDQSSLSPTTRLDTLIQILRKQFPDLLLARDASEVGAPILVAVKEMDAKGELAVVRVLASPLSANKTNFGVSWSCWPASIHQGKERKKCPPWRSDYSDARLFYFCTSDRGWSLYRAFFFLHEGSERDISNQTIDLASRTAADISDCLNNILLGN